MKYGDKGKEVETFQQLLVWNINALYLTGDLKIDGSWGDKTQALFEQFLETKGLPKTLTLSGKAKYEIYKPIERLNEIETLVEVSEDFSRQLVLVAQYIYNQKPMEFQVVSENISNNGGIYVKWLFDLTDDSWDDNLHGNEYAHCAAFVCKCLKIASKITGKKSPIKTIAKNWRVPNIASEAKEKKIFINGSTNWDSVKAGDLVLCRKINGSWRHTGIVESAEGDVIKTIESNTCGNRNCQTVKRIILNRPENNNRWDFVRIEA